MGQFGDLVLATVATAHYFYTVPQINTQQPHHRLLTVVLVTGVPYSSNKAYSIGLQKSLRRTLLHADAIIIDSRKTSSFPNCMNSRRNTGHALFKTVT